MNIVYHEHHVTPCNTMHHGQTAVAVLCTAPLPCFISKASFVHDHASVPCAGNSQAAITEQGDSMSALPHNHD